MIDFSVDHTEDWRLPRPVARKKILEIDAFDFLIVVSMPSIRRP